MTKPVIVCVRGEQTLPDGGHTADTLRCEGTLERRANGWRIAYEEQTEDGAVHAELLLTARRASLTRTGTVRSRMLFAPAERHGAFYELPPARLTLEVETTSLEIRLTEDGGTVALRYRLLTQGETISDNALTLTLTPR